MSATRQARLVRQTVAGLSPDAREVLRVLWRLSDGRQCLYQEIVDALGPSGRDGQPHSHHLAGLVALSLVDPHLPSEHAFNLRGYTLRDRLATAAGLAASAPQAASYRRGRLSPLATRSLTPLATRSATARYPLLAGAR